jgi:hypothetical protein
MPPRLQGCTRGQLPASSQAAINTSGIAALVQGPSLALKNTASPRITFSTNCSFPGLNRGPVPAAVPYGMSHPLGSVRHFARRLRRQPLPFEDEFNEDEFQEWLYEFEVGHDVTDVCNYHLLTCTHPVHVMGGQEGMSREPEGCCCC